jgi:hypothetical protein
MSSEAQVRFRHTCGVDSGPYAFPLTDTIEKLKTKLLEEWPSGKPGLGSPRPLTKRLLVLAPLNSAGSRVERIISVLA